MTSKGSPGRRAARWRRAAAWGAQRSPEWFVRGAPVVIGVFFFVVLSETRRRVRRNLRRVTGRARFVQVVGTFVEFARALTAALAPERQMFAERRIDIEGKEHVEPLLKAGRGMVMLTAHVGPWDACALRLGRTTGARVVMIMSPEADEAASDFQDNLRSSVDVNVLRIGRSALDLLPLIDHVKSGGIIVAQADRMPEGAPGLAVEMAGGPFLMPEGLFRMARALGCPVVPAFAARVDSSADRISVFPPSFDLKTGEARLSAAKKVAHHLEGHLRKYPTQWFHFVD